MATTAVRVTTITLRNNTKVKSLVPLSGPQGLCLLGRDQNTGGHDSDPKENYKPIYWFFF